MADPVTSVALGVLGASVGAGGTLMAGNAQADALNTTRFTQLLAGQNKQKELTQAADTALASSQRQAMEASRNKDMLLSKARAAAGASGAGVTDTSVVNTMANIEQMGEFQKAMQMFGGLETSAGLKWEADNAWKEAVNNDAATQYQAGMTRYKSKMDAMGTLLSGAGTALSDYTKYKKERDQNMRAALGKL
ncbi:hypothetical protein AMST5_01954 [freshwater sediment metagenome]|uniref:Uncharacterized protein n=1 Tax=freshwater sediment metagenome TaxID=556182 RepID=A0AA48LZ75_9ZZZZ